MTATTLKERDTFVPHYSVRSMRDETAYSVPLSEAGDRGSHIEVKFRFCNRNAAGASPPDNYHGIGVDFALEVYGEGGELLATVPVERRTSSRFRRS